MMARLFRVLARALVTRRKHPLFEYLLPRPEWLATGPIPPGEREAYRRISGGLAE